jgi:hypothetical protein
MPGTTECQTMKTKSVFHVFLFGILIMSVASCSNAPSETSADSSVPADKTGGLLDSVKPEPKVTIPAGTRIHVALIDGVSSNNSSAGDQFTASLTQPIVVNGKTVFPKGTTVRGRVVDAKESGRVQGRASIQLRLTNVVRDNASDVAISTKTYSAVAANTKKRDAAIIGGGAGLGAAIGAITGGGKGAAIGAAVGGGAGTGTVLATKGKEIHYGPEAKLTFTLSQPVEI